MDQPCFTQRTAYVHVGTHKTGTTSIQALLAMNDRALHDAGVLIPQTGRIESGLAGHHNIAWELAGHPQFDPRFGTFENLLCEIASADNTNVCLTSEEFEFLHLDEAALRRLRDGLIGVGCVPKIILYLRPQADYLESLYAQLSPVWNIDFPNFLDTIVEAGMYGCSWFDYDRLASSFSDIFGPDCIVVRAYQSAAPTEKLLREFLETIADKRLGLSQLTIPGRLNSMALFPEVIAARERQLSCTCHHSMAADQRFDPLSLFDIVRLMVRFSRSNERIRRVHGARIGCVTPGTFAREVIAEAFRDRASRFRKQLIRALIENEDGVAA